MKERKAIQDLKNREDKGSTVVVMNKEDYIAEANRQLLNETFYKKLDSDRTKNHAKAVEAILEEMFQNQEISEETFACLLLNKE